MIATHLIVQIVTHFLLTVFYSINISSSCLSLAEPEKSQSGSLLLIPSGSHQQLNSTTELSTDLISRLSQYDPSLINATSDIPIWDSSNIDSDSINETIKTLIDNMDNITTPVFMVPDDLDVTVKLDNVSDDVTITVNGNSTDLTSTQPTTTTTSESTTSSQSSPTSSPSPSMSTSSGSMNESKVIYETTTTQKINLINIDEHLNEPNKPGTGGSGGSNEEDAELLPGENQASRVACNLEGDLLCSGSTPTCYGSGNIECGESGQTESTGARKRSTTSQRFTSSPTDESATDQCQISGDIICSSVVTRSQCKGSAICKADKMEETIMSYNYWQILLIAGALAIICVTIIVVGIVGYFSWTRYKVRPEANGQTNQASNKA